MDDGNTVLLNPSEENSLPNPDPSTFQPPTALIAEEDFEDDFQPGAVWHFRFKAEPGVNTESRIAIKTRENHLKYVKPEDGRFPAPLPPVGTGGNRRELFVSPEIIQTLSALEVLQDPADEADRWNIAQWAHFSLIAPNAFKDACEFANELVSRVGDSGKNLPSPSTA